MPALELIAQDADAVRVARSVGAARVELCQALALGGLTPSIGTVHAAVAASGGAMDVFALIRPRAGGFIYDDDDIRVMESDVREIVAAGATGVVIGAVTAQGVLDRDVLTRLRDAAEGAPIGVHRAIDVTLDPIAALDEVIALGAARVLTSGGAPTALAGANVLTRMVAHAAGRTEIMAGSGITAASVAQIVATGVDAVHASVKRTVTDDSLAMGSADGGYERIDAGQAARLAEILRGISG